MFLVPLMTMFPMILTLLVILLTRSKPFANIAIDVFGEARTTIRSACIVGKISFEAKFCESFEVKV